MTYLVAMAEFHVPYLNIKGNNLKIKRNNLPDVSFIPSLTDLERTVGNAVLDYIYNRGVYEISLDLKFGEKSSRFFPLARIPEKNEKQADAVYQALYGLLKGGRYQLLRFFLILANEISKQRVKFSRGKVYGEEHKFWAFWYEQILSGNLTPNEARTIPRKVYSLRRRLADILKSRGYSAPEATAQSTYGYALVSKELLNNPELAVAIAEINVDLTEQEAMAILSKGYSQTEIIQRLQGIKQWSKRTQITLTPRLVDYLVSHSDTNRSFATLDVLLARTASGNFNVGNELQKELEFGKYISTVLQGSKEPLLSRGKFYDDFQRLEPLPPVEGEPTILNLVEMGSIERAAYEAALFHRFVQSLRDSSSRNIYVIGNIRYGQLFVVQPLEDLLDLNIRIGYYSVKSSTTDDTSVPDIFPTAFVRELATSMPHLVIVDNASPSSGKNQSRFSRATLGYANWFALFNDLRTNGKVAEYLNETSLTSDHLHMLRASSDFAKMKEKIYQIVGRGDIYKVVQWMPHLEERVAYGNVTANRQPFDHIDDRPLVVLANPIVYKQWIEGMHPSLKGTSPNFWDDPGGYSSKTIIGFGPKGIESRTLIEVVQQGIARGIGKYLREMWKQVNDTPKLTIQTKSNKRHK